MTSAESGKAFRALLISTSVLGLAAGWTLGAQEVAAAGTEVTDTTVTGVAIGAAQSTDYVLISNSIVTTDGVVNDGTIGAVAPNTTGILVTNGSNVTGGIANNGDLSAIEEGIIVDGNSTVNGGIANSGNITVGADVAGSEVDEAVGVGVYDTGTDITVGNSGTIDVTAFQTAAEIDPNSDSFATATGINVTSYGGNLDATVNNSGTVTVSATAENDDSSHANATGIGTYFYNLAEVPPGTANSTVINSSASTIDVSAVAVADTSIFDQTANAQAIGIEQYAADPDALDFDATNSGTILVSASGTADANSANATAFTTATGISQVSDGSPFTEMMTASNSGLIQVSSIASAAISSFGVSALADAEAMGIEQQFDFGNMTGSVTNTGNIDVGATAMVDGNASNATANAQATGIYQDADGGESSGLTVDLSASVDSGTVGASALASVVGDNTADAMAVARGVSQAGLGVDTVFLSATNGGEIVASASADAQTSFLFATSTARAEAYGIQQTSFSFDTVDINVSSSGTISAMASAGLDETLDTDAAFAEAFGVRQEASGFGEISATANVTGDIEVSAMSQANSSEAGAANARAQATGIQQTGASLFEDIQFLATTDGNTNVTAVAAAESDSGASAVAGAIGIDQSAVGNTAAGASASNTGTMIIESSATASGAEYGYAEAYGAGIRQVRSDGFSSSGFGGLLVGQGVINSSFSTIDVTVTASASGSGSNTANADGFGITQNVSRTTDNAATADNSGGIVVDVDAMATSTEDFSPANARAGAFGISQDVYSASGNAAGTITSGIMSVSSMAEANSTGACADASARTSSIGLFQSVSGASAAASGNITSSISLDVSATASAEASSGADANAVAFGIHQAFSYADGGSSNVLNSGNLSVSAMANSIGASFGSSSSANAAGILIDAGGSTATLDVEADNTGNIMVSALASSSGTEEATAAGMSVIAPSATGNIANNGNIMVSASAANGSADAYGIRVQTDGFDGTVGNYGTIVSDATEAVPGTAYGIVVEQLETPSGTMTTIENDGHLEAQVAISTLNAPGPSQINQLGGLILGDIWLSESYADTVEFTVGTIEGDTFGSGDDDVFNFRSGSGSGAPTVTYIGQLDGLSEINVHPGMAYLDGGVSNTGALNVLGGGRLELSSNGPTQVDVGSYMQAPTGMLIYEITPDPSSAAQINGTTVSLDGSVTVDPLPGFYPNSITYEEVVVSGGPTGTWSTVVDTALLDVEAIYQPDNTVDLSVMRIPFDEVDGLNENEQALGGGLEEIYDSSEGTPLGEAIEELFALDPDAYREVLSSLVPSEYAQGLQALLDSQRMFQNSVLGHLGHGGGANGTQSATLGRLDFVSGQMAAAGTDESGGAAAPDRQQMAAGEARGRNSGTVGVWARAYGDFGNNDGDSSAVGFEQDQYGFAVGADIAAAEGLVFGLAGGYSDTDLDFDNGNDIDYDGFQVAAYGSFAPNAWYLDGMVSYAWYDNDSRRSTIGGTAKGDYDSEVFTAYAETGYELKVDPVYFTPFLGVGYAHAETDSFTESGAGAFNMSIDSADADSFTTTLGLDVAARLQVDRDVFLVPEVRVGWEHEFEDDHQSIGASFAGAPASGFTVVGSQVADDSAVVGAGLSLEIGKTWQIYVDYDGRLNEDYSQHAVSGGVKLTW